ncbi:MAG: phosphoribosyl-ATP diphosphatase [Proteobacteria bacterium]|nr:phosphoribosyl-ATP diphosphatase [Pseudomonadota bacterium]
MSDSIQRLYESILKAKRHDAPQSRTAKLMRDGTTKIAKKLAEEAVEVGHEAILRDRKATIEESADVLYNLAVLWADAGIKPQDVFDEMLRREQLMGIAEKLPKSAAQLAVTRAIHAHPPSPEPQKTQKWSFRTLAHRLGIGHK